MVQCVIVDDHVMVLELLTGAVQTIPGVAVAATATDLSDAERIAGLDQVDLLVVDRKLRSGDGMDFIRTVVPRHPRVKCIVIAGSTLDFVCPPDVIDHVVSVVDKTEACDTLLAAIKKISSDVAPDAGHQRSLDGIESLLTQREFELFKVIGQGLSNKQIGQRLGISPRTVETHRKSIARKLGNSGSALVHLATRYCHAHVPSARPLLPAADMTSPPSDNR